MDFVDIKYAIILTFDSWDLKLQVLKDLRKILGGSDKDSRTYKKAHECYWELFPTLWFQQIDDVIEKWWDFLEEEECKKLAYPEIYGDL